MAARDRASRGRPRGFAGPALAGLVLGGAALAAIHLVRAESYWDYSEGVYAYTARALLHGGDLYGHMVVAQPPWQFLGGALLLAIHDSLGWLRLGVGLVQLLTGMLCALTVWRLTASRAASALAVPLALLTPWAVHENGAITPEMFAPPLFLGAALLAARPGRSAAAGALAAVGPFLKWPFAVPLAAIVLVARDRKRALLAAVAVLALQAIVFTAIFGSGLWTDTVVAQLGSGRRGPAVLKGVWAQAGWNLIGLVLPALAALAYRSRARDPLLLRASAATALGFLITLVTNTKEGTGLNILVPVEAALVPLALAGATWALQSARPRLVPAVALAAIGLVVAQGISLLAAPRSDEPFLRPGSRTAWGVALTGSQVAVEAGRARACDRRLAYPGPPFIAFIAHRRMPDGQPDQFLTAKAARFHDVLERMQHDTPFCPVPPLVEPLG